MTQPKLDELMGGVREAMTPNQDDKARVSALLAATLAAGATATTVGAAIAATGTAGATTKGAAAGFSAGSLLSAAGVKWAGIVALAAIGAGGVFLAQGPSTLTTRTENKPAFTPATSGNESSSEAAHRDRVNPITTTPEEAPTAKEQRAAPLTEETIQPIIKQRPTNARPKRASVSRQQEKGRQSVSELELISRAGSAIRAGRHQEALSLLSQHQSGYPRGQFAQERRGLQIWARCGAEGGAAANDAARSFAKSHPQSPLALHFDTGCPKK